MLTCYGSTPNLQCKLLHEAVEKSVPLYLKSQVDLPQNTPKQLVLIILSVHLTLALPWTQYINYGWYDHLQLPPETAFLSPLFIGHLETYRMACSELGHVRTSTDFRGRSCVCVCLFYIWNVLRVSLLRDLF